MITWPDLTEESKHCRDGAYRRYPKPWVAHLIFWIAVAFLLWAAWWVQTDGGMEWLREQGLIR
jgi:hypothetical protein